MRCNMMRFRSVLVITFIGLTTTGCGLPTLQLRTDFDLHKASFHDKLATDRKLAQQFLACTTQAYDERTGTQHIGQSPAETIRTPPSNLNGHGPLHLAPIQAVIDRIKERRRDHADSLTALGDLVRDWKHDAHGKLDLNKLHKLVDVIKQWHAHLDFDEDALAGETSRFSQLLLAYNKAYFGNIRFAVGKAETGRGIRLATKISSDGFIDRNGNAWRFPGVSVEVTKDTGPAISVGSTRVDSQRLSSDLVRLFLEAFFDAAFREPAVQGATALQVEWKADNQSYPAFDAEYPAIPLDAFARITRDALRAEATVTSLVGKTVRGGSVFSIQNETVAATLETAAGVIAKKLVEHEGFCYYQTIKGHSSMEPHESSPAGS